VVWYVLVDVAILVTLGLGVADEDDELFSGEGVSRSSMLHGARGSSLPLVSPWFFVKRMKM
jgi:hypothetical protein